MNDQMIKSIADWFSVPVVFVLLAQLGAAIWWIWVRTGKLSIIFHRLFRIIVGDISNKDSVLGKATDEHLNLMYFRLMFFPSVRTQSQAERLVKYAVDHDEELGDVAACGLYFDVEKLYVRSEKLPKLKGMVVRIFFVGGLLFGALLAGIVMATSNVLIQYKPTQQYFWLLPDEVRTINGEVRVRAEQCAAKTFADNAPEPGVRDTICELLQTPKDLERHLKTLPLQRTLFLIISIAMAFPGVAIYRDCRQADGARKLLRRLNERDETSQAEHLIGDEVTVGA